MFFTYFYYLKIPYNIFWSHCFPSLNSSKEHPTQTIQFHLLSFFLQTKKLKRNEKKENQHKQNPSCPSEKNNKTKTHGKPWNPFCVCQLLLLLGRALHWCVVDVPRDISSRKMDFSFPNKYQLLIASWLGTDSSAFSILGFCLVKTVYVYCM